MTTIKNAAPPRPHGAWQRAAVEPGGVHHLPQVPLAPAATYLRCSCGERCADDTALINHTYGSHGRPPRLAECDEVTR